MPVEVTENIIKAFCELTEDGKKMAVYFHYAPVIQSWLKELVPAARFSGYEVEHPHWTLPLELSSGQALREIFGVGLQLGDGVRSWGWQEKRLDTQLRSLVTAIDADLKRLPKTAPLIERVIAGEPVPEFGLPRHHPLSCKRDPRPYQRADIAMMAAANVLNANSPGTGKSLETIGAIYEAGLEGGPQLICAPVRSLENVWRIEIERLVGGEVYTSEEPAERRRQVAEGLERAKAGEPVWILVNHDMLRAIKIFPKIDKVLKKDIAWTANSGQAYGYRDAIMRDICHIKWSTFSIDEFHMAGLNNAGSLFTIGTGLIKAQRQWRLSGTPMGGKVANLFPVLRSIEPKKFSNKWDWMGKWLDLSASSNGHRKIGNLAEGREADFYDAHARYMVRRLKRDALPGIPAKQIVEVKCSMTSKQRKQYAKFEADAEVAISGHDGEPVSVIGTCILAEFARLKQFANAYCVIDKDGFVQPTEESGKLPQLEERLDEFGIRKLMPEPNSRAIVASESKRMMKMVSAWMTSRGITNGLLTGDTKGSDTEKYGWGSQHMLDYFQTGDDGMPYVLCMTTQTGGVSLNLERAGSVHILDEMWNPDRQEQLEDRGDRGTRETPLVCLYYRTEDSIQEYIAKVANGKKITNANVLDVYRKMIKAGW